MLRVGGDKQGGNSKRLPVFLREDAEGDRGLVSGSLLKISVGWTKKESLRPLRRLAVPQPGPTRRFGSPQEFRTVGTGTRWSLRKAFTPCTDAAVLWVPPSGLRGPRPAPSPRGAGQSGVTAPRHAKSGTAASRSRHRGARAVQL